jgi:hypothetical protein
VFGELQVGAPGAPFQHAASIVLHGDVGSEALVLDDNYFLGNKVLAVFGNLTLVGPAPSTAWCRLAAPAPAGATSITVNNVVAWPIGGKIVVTATEYVSGYSGTLTPGPCTLKAFFGVAGTAWVSCAPKQPPRARSTVMPLSAPTAHAVA